MISKPKPFLFVEPTSFCMTCSYIVRIPTNSSRGMASRSLEVLRAVS